MDFLIIHGSFGSKDGNWFPWLKKKLEELGHNVFLPQFPVGVEVQSLKSWTKTIENLNLPWDNLVIIAHSIGPSFALSLLEKHRVKACFFASGFAEFYELIPEYDKVNRSFVDKNFNLDLIKKNCERFLLYHGDDDPYVPLKYAKDLSEKLNGKLTIIPNGKHLNSENDMYEFPKLLEDIKNFIQN